MNYYTTKIMNLPFEEAVKKVTEELKKEGFGVLTEIDVQAVLKNKLNADFRKYRILGACNPPFALKALQREEYIGLMLPCNVVVQEKGDISEVAVINPINSMQAVQNPELEKIASEISIKLGNVINNL